MARTRGWDWGEVATRVALVAVVLVGTAVVAGWKEFSECVADYQDKAAAATRARAAAADTDRQAEDDMWQAFADAGDPTKVPPAEAQAYAKKAFQAFLKQRADARRQRAASPLPAGPSNTCT